MAKKKPNSNQLSMDQIDAFTTEAEIQKISSYVIAPLTAAGIATIRTDPEREEAYAASVRQLATVLKSFDAETLRHATNLIIRNYDKASIRPAAILAMCEKAEDQLKPRNNAEMNDRELYARCWRDGKTEMSAFHFTAHPGHPQRLLEGGFLKLHELIHTDKAGRKDTSWLNAEQFEQLLKDGYLTEAQRMPQHITDEDARNQALAINRMLAVTVQAPGYWVKRGITTPRQAREHLSQRYNQIRLDSAHKLAEKTVQLQQSDPDEQFID